MTFKEGLEIVGNDSYVSKCFLSRLSFLSLSLFFPLTEHIQARITYKGIVCIRLF